MASNNNLKFRLLDEKFIAIENDEEVAVWQILGQCSPGFFGVTRIWDNAQLSAPQTEIRTARDLAGYALFDTQVAALDYIGASVPTASN